MLIRMLDTDPVLYLALVGSVIVSIVLHELGHAYAADRQGDPTPRMLGHFTWNPVVHMGWLSLALVALFGLGFGRTPVQPRNFRNRRWGEAIVSFAGPAVNLTIWLVMVAALVVAVVFGGLGGAAAVDALGPFFKFANLLATLNLLLFVFNMIPVPPFDGFTVAQAFVDFGELGVALRRAGSIPMILVFVVVMNTEVLGWVYGATTQVVLGVTRLLGVTS